MPIIAYEGKQDTTFDVKIVRYGKAESYCDLPPQRIPLFKLELSV